MFKSAIASAIVVCLLLGANGAAACGDKLLYLGRIYRAHNVAGKTVAVFDRPNSLLANAATPKVAKAFQDEGYHLLLLNNHRDLIQALRSDVADVVIVDIADVGTIQKPALEARIPIIPVFDKRDSRLKVEAKRYPAVIKSPVKPEKCLDALDQAFDSESSPKSHFRSRAMPVSRQ